MIYNVVMDKEKRNARQQRYTKTKDRINFVMEKGTKARINEAAAAAGISAAEFIRQAIEEKLSNGSPPGIIPELEHEPYYDN